MPLRFQPSLGLRPNRRDSLPAAVVKVATGVSNCLRPPTNSENELLFGTIAPPRLASRFCVRSGAFTSTNGLVPLRMLSRMRVEKPPRIGPMPARVMMSMPSLSAEWFSAGNVSRTIRIDWMTSRDGRLPRLKPSMRTRALPPAMSISWRISSCGSSGNASSSSCVSVVDSMLFGSAAAACAFGATSTVSSNAVSVSSMDRLLSPARNRTSGTSPVSKPENSAVIVYRPGFSAGMVARPWSFAVTVMPAAPAGSAGVMVTLAPGRIAPVTSMTVTSARASRLACAEHTTASVMNAAANRLILEHDIRRGTANIITDLRRAGPGVYRRVDGRLARPLGHA